MSSVFLFLVLLPYVLSFCRYPAPPVEKDDMVVKTRVFAEMPESSIISIKPYPGSDDIAVVTRSKIFRVFPNGQSKLLLDVGDAFRRKSVGGQLNTTGAHSGVRSIAFHPGFLSNGLVYISAMEKRPPNPRSSQYISDSNDMSGEVLADSVVVEYRMRNGVLDEQSYRLLFRVGMPVFDHPVKQIEFFGPFLYIAHGDGSFQSAEVGGGLRNDALGKILRINPLANNGKPYTIPSVNVFPNSYRPNMPPEVFAFGFRNPHTICFDKAGLLYVADAGRDNREEINIVRNGKNYGWSDREGTCVHKKDGGIDEGVEDIPFMERFNYVYPVMEYRHIGPVGKGFIGVAVAGGCPVENDSLMGGKYWFTDFPISGDLHFGHLQAMRNATTEGPRNQLTQARIFKVKILFNGRVFKNLYEVVKSESPRISRVDVRMGRDRNGVLYWSSKKDGRVYVFESSR